MKVVFFNYYHNGDIHVSRGIIRKIIEKVKQLDATVSFEYSHRNPANLLLDIPNLTYNQFAINNVSSDHHNMIKIGDTVYINTWYAQQHFKYMNRYGITMDSLYVGLEDSCKDLWGFSFSDISTDVSSFFPIIDYSKFEIGHATNWLAAHPEPKILVENGQALSGQATNFAMSPIIVTLAIKHPNKTFILANNDGTYGLPSNVFYASDIIKKTHRSELNEISFLSSQCDMIIGRSSGVFSFCLTQENLFQRTPTFLSFSNIEPKTKGKYWLGDLLQDKVNYSAKMETFNESDINRVREIINDHL